MRLTELRTKNITRRNRWHGAADAWTGADWSNAMCGEAGEAANVVKKLRRHETGAGDTITNYNTPSKEELHSRLADELADVICYCDLLAEHYGINLELAVVSKFNRISKAQGFPERLV